MNPNNLTQEQIKQGYSTIEGAFDPLTGKLKSSNVITPQSLQPQTPITGLPTTPTPTEAPKQTPIDYDAMFGLTDFQKQAEQTQETGISEIIKNMGIVQNEATDLQAERQRRGLEDMYKSGQAIKSRIGALDAEMQQDDIVLAQKMRNEERRDTLLPFAQMGQQKLAGDAAIYRGLKTAEKNTLISQQLAQQGEIALAEQFAKDAIDAKYAPYKQNIENYKTLLEIIKPSLTAAENKRLKAQEAKVSAAENEIQKAEANETAINKILLDATPNAPAEIIANAKAVKERGGSALEVAQALGKYGGDYLKTEMLKEQIKTEKAQQANIYNTISARNADTARQNAEASGTGGVKLTADEKKAQTASKNLVGLLDTYKKEIEGISFLQANSPAKRTAINSLKGRITAEYKQAKQLGTLDAGVQKLIDSIIPNPGDLSISSLNNAAQVKAIDDFKASFEVSTPELDTYFNAATGSIQTVNNQINNKEKSFLMSLPK